MPRVCGAGLYNTELPPAAVRRDHHHRRRTRLCAAACAAWLLGSVAARFCFTVHSGLGVGSWRRLLNYTETVNACMAPCC